MLRVLVLWTLCALAAGNSLRDKSVCDKMVTIDGQHYVKETLTTIDGVPSDISVDWKTGNIFFTNMKDCPLLKLFVLKKGEMYPKRIAGLRTTGYSSAVDQTNGVVYLSNKEGIYIYDEITNEAHPFAANGTSIVYLGLYTAGGETTIYFVQFPSLDVYKLSVADKTKLELFNKISRGYNLVIDSQGHFYYDNQKFAYMLIKGETRRRVINNIQYNNVKDFIVDKHDNVWIANYNGDLYKIDKENASARLVGNVGYSFVETVGIDKDDNIIVGIEDALVKLTKVDVNPC